MFEASLGNSVGPCLKNRIKMAGGMWRVVTWTLVSDSLMDTFVLGANSAKMQVQMPSVAMVTLARGGYVPSCTALTVGTLDSDTYSWE